MIKIMNLFVESAKTQIRKMILNKNVLHLCLPNEYAIGRVVSSSIVAKEASYVFIATFIF